MRWMLIVGVCLSWMAASVQAEIYRCETEDGLVEFSQTPCAEDAETINIQSSSGGGQGAVCRRAADNMVNLTRHLGEQMGGVTGTDAEFRRGSIEACMDDMADPQLAEGWQCMADAGTLEAQQECAAGDLRRVLGGTVRN